MQLKLKNPLLFFDIESTGLDVAKDRIVELCLLKIYPNGEKDEKTLRFNPTVPISPEAEAIHGISNRDVAHEPTFKQVAKELSRWIEGCDLAGYNSSRFDIPLLAEEFLRAGIEVDFKKRKLIDVQNIFHKMEQRTLKAAYKFYCKKDLESAHTAAGDTHATFEVLQAQLDCYKDLQNDVAFLADFSTLTHNVDYAGRFVYDNNNNILFNFGKHKGKKAAEVLAKEPSYYSWMMNGDFTLDTKKILTEIYLSLSK